MHLMLLAIAPVIIILFYIYSRDKYEKEPFYLLAKGLMFGIISVLPVTLVEGVLMMFGPLFTGYWNTFYQAFVVAGATEEGFKFLASFILVWHSVSSISGSMELFMPYSSPWVLRWSKTCCTYSPARMVCRSD